MEHHKDIQQVNVRICKDFKLEEPEEEPEIEELEEEEETIPARPHKKRVPESEDEDKE